MKVGIILPLGEDKSTGAPPSYQTLRTMTLRAEEAGFDSIWVADHLLYRFPDEKNDNELRTVSVWECWTILSALAEATSRVELGMLVICVPFRHPAVLAKMATTLDEVAGGRVILGLGAGWHKPEFDAFGAEFDHLGSRFDEALQIICPLIREGKVDFQGQYYFANEAEMVPRGPRPGKPEILVASRGERMLRLTARYADQWNTAWLGQPTLFHERYDKLKAACAEVGRDPSTLEVTVGVTVNYDEGDDVDERLKNPDYALSGSPQEIAAGLQAYADLGVGHVICALNPNTPKAVGKLSEALPVLRTSPPGPLS
jgi:probable F420-dependent oxidoreductase